MSPVPKSHPLRRWFAGLVESSFQTEIGLCDPNLLDYLGELLTEFIHVERIHTLGDGRRIENIAEMLSDAESGPCTLSEERRRAYHRHIGDYTLFWTGIYPENLKRLRKQRAADSLLDYFQQGKRSYAIASELSSEETQPPATLLRQLSERFEYCVYGLGLVRKNWEIADPRGFEAAKIMWR